MIRKMLSHIHVVVFMGLLASTAQAIEVITVVQKDCTSTTGFVVNADESQFTLLTSAGKIQKAKTQDISQIVVHSVVDFPFTLSNLNPETPWYEITLLDQEKSRFWGTPVQFIDDLIFFLNQNGKVEVVPFLHVGKAVASKDTPAVNWKGTLANFDFSNVRSSCSGLAQGQIPPTRTLNDPVQIEEFFRNFEKGYDRFNQLRERMNFYARPMIFKPTSRLGFLVQQKNPESVDVSLFNFKVSSGEPFGLQSSTEALSIQNDWIPFYFQTLSASFLVKSHLFHAIFVGHLPSLTGGAKYFNGSAPDGESFEFKKEPFFMSHSFNYLTEFGFDYREYSISFGGYYPIQYVMNDNTNREILASSMQPALILTYTTENWRLRFSGSKYKMEHNAAGQDPTVIIAGVGSNDTAKGNTDGHFYRVGLDVDLPASVQVKLDALEHAWKYADSAPFTADANERTYAVSIGRDFGRYVSLRAYLASINYTWSVNDNGIANNLNPSKTYVGGEFEFIF